MLYLRPIPRRLLPDDMDVWASDGAGGLGDVVRVRHVRLEMADAVIGDAYRASVVGGKVFVDAANSSGAFEVPAGSMVKVGELPRMRVLSCRRLCTTGGRVHHWELEVG